MPQLPIDSALPGLRAALERSSRLIVEAPPGAGKTTRVPLAIISEAWLKGQKIIMLEPRRLAARAAARHMAALLGQEVGRAVGYRTALDGRESPASRILVVTEGILTRMIQADPALEGIGCVIFDEFHERSLQADLGLALCLDSQESLRPDLRLVIMSATLEGDRLADFLDDCARIRAEGRSFPVTVRYRPPSGPNPRCEDTTAQAVLEALGAESGSILVFLPGAAEIRRTADLLRPALPDGVFIRPLYGDLPPEEQDAAVSPARAGERKIVLATNIAESSLTIEGVRVVVDSGLERVLRFEPAWGMSRLVTARVSQASAEQRRGRAGRLEAGLCLRLWPEQEQAAMRPNPRPEILEADLASLCLEVAAWGLPASKATATLHWLDAPPPSAWEEARRLLRALGALDRQDLATPRGRSMAELPMHPRLAHMVLEGKARGQGLHACATAALFAERDPLRSGDLGADLSARLALLLDRADKKTNSTPILSRLREQMRRIAARAGLQNSSAANESPDPGPLLAMAWPERVALRRAPGSYLMRNGRGAALRPDDPLAARACLAIAELQGGESLADARIRLAAPLDLADLEMLFAADITVEEHVFWDAGRRAVSARRLRRLDALILEETPLAAPNPENVRRILLEGLARLGAEALPWTEEQLQLRQRVAFLRGLAQKGMPMRPDLPEWPDLSGPALTAGLPDWLGSHLDTADRLSRVTPEMLGAGLAELLPWPLPARLEELAPAFLEAPSGSRIRLDYGQAPESPVMAVKLQEMFGLDKHPAVGGGHVPVTLHLLSPAGRPVQVTGDLPGFWQTGYRAVRADLRGRYPKHPWPEDPLKAAPTRKTKKALERSTKAR